MWIRPLNNGKPICVFTRLKTLRLISRLRSRMSTLLLRQNAQGTARNSPSLETSIRYRKQSTRNGAGQLYVAKHFPPEAKKQALTLINNLSAALKARIEKLDWMSAETKKRALEKWQTFLSQIGYPDQWRDYSALRLKAGDYFGSIQAAARFNHAYAMSRIGQPTDR